MMFEHTDWIGWVLAIIGIGYGVYENWRTRCRLDIAHAGLVSLKPGIRGENRDDVIAAINDLLSKLKR